MRDVITDTYSPILAESLAFGNAYLISLSMVKCTTLKLRSCDWKRRSFARNAFLSQQTRHPLLLGFPWLRRHNPHLDWTTVPMLGWSSSCHQVCLKQVAAPQTSARSSSSTDVLGVLAEYLDFREVFSKAKATSLLPHRPYNCAINLQPGPVSP